MENSETKIQKSSLLFERHEPTTLHQYMKKQMSQYPNNVAFVDPVTKAETSYSTVLDKVNRLAAGLQVTHGLAKGQYVALALPNCAEYIISLLAVSQCGGVTSLINPLYTTRELEHVACITQPTLWICAPEFLASLATLTESAATHQYSTKAIVVDLANQDSSEWHSLVQSGRPEQFVEPTFDVYQDLVDMPFSSGTTGLPKGVMTTHHNLVTGLWQASKTWVKYEAGWTLMALLPMYHMYGCNIILAALINGARVIFLPKFSLAGFLQTIQDEKVNVLTLVPPIALLLSKDPIVDSFDLNSIKRIHIGAAPLSPNLMTNLEEKFKFSDILEGFGMTETTFGSHCNLPGMRRLGSIGLLLPFLEAKMIDSETGQILSAGQVGEMCLRGDTIVKGYKDNDTATAEAIDAEGWLHTGDLGYYDQDGFYYIVDRLKELIKFKGLQVAPSELESLLLTHPEVADAAVIGIPDEEAGELPRAYVVKKAESELNQQEIDTFIEGKVSSYKKFRGGVIFITAIPKSASGKILRRQLRAIAASS